MIQIHFKKAHFLIILGRHNSRLRLLSGRFQNRMRLFFIIHYSLLRNFHYSIDFPYILGSGGFGGGNGGGSEIVSGSGGG